MFSYHQDLHDYLPVGFATRQWLLDQGMPVHTLDNALKSGKLVSLARGVVSHPRLANEPWDLGDVVASLNRELPEPVYVGGLAALSRAGLAHYASFNKREQLYSPLRMPAWFARMAISQNYVWHGTARLWDNAWLQNENHFRTFDFPWDGLKALATPEQAWLEVLAQVPNGISFEHADNLMQGLSVLSPRRLDALLRVCRHVLAKRLFFFFADRYDYPWRKYLNAADYDLGAGKRSVEAGGKLDKTYLITVPESLHGSA